MGALWSPVGKGLTSWLSFVVSNCESDMCLTADPEVAGSIPIWSHTFVEIDHETVILLHSTDSRRVLVSYKRKYVHEVPVNYLVKLAQEKICLSELTVPT